MAGAAITGLAELACHSDFIYKPVSASVFEDTPEAAQVKQGLESGLVDSALVGVFVDVTDRLPLNAQGFVSSNGMLVLETLEVQIDG